jgi:hypothetical protein
MQRRTEAAQSRGSRRIPIAVCGLLLCLATSATAQYPTPTDPVPGTGINQLIGIGSVASLGGAGFRLTPSLPYRRGGVWMINKLPVANGFQSTFQFRITNPGGLVQYTPFGFQQGGDGFAFVIQNFGIPVLGPPAGYLGYHGIPNSMAIEFDTWLNYEAGFFDPNGNHISVHSRGPAANSVSEAASLGRTTAIPFLKDGATHLARIDYTPGVLSVFVDNLASPVLTLSGLNLSTLLNLDNGSAWVGFTSGTGSAYQTHDILSWQITGTTLPFPGGVPFPVTTTPTTPTPTTPTDPFILPPPPTSPPTTGTTNPPLDFPYPPGQ